MTISWLGKFIGGYRRLPLLDMIVRCELDNHELTGGRYGCDGLGGCRNEYKQCGLSFSVNSLFGKDIKRKSNPGKGSGFFIGKKNVVLRYLNQLNLYLKLNANPAYQ